MADPSGSPDFLGFITSLPPQLQGIAIFGVTLGAGLFLGRRFLKRLVTEQPEPRILAVGDPTTFTDMKPVKDLLDNVNLLAIQAQKSEVGVAALTGAFVEHVSQLSRLTDIVGQLVVDMREERQQEAAEELRERFIEEGRQKALEELNAKQRRRRATARTRPRVKPPG